MILTLSKTMFQVKVWRLRLTIEYIKTLRIGKPQVAPMTNVTKLFSTINIDCFPLSFNGTGPCNNIWFIGLLSLFLSFSLSLTHTHTFTLTLSLCFTLSPSLFLSLFLSHSFFFSVPLSYSPSLLLSCSSSLPIPLRHPLSPLSLWF
jgi:hypothetical protein